MGWVRSPVGSVGKCPFHFPLSVSSGSGTEPTAWLCLVYRSQNRTHLHPDFHLRLVFEMPSASRCSAAEMWAEVAGVAHSSIKHLFLPGACPQMAWLIQ